MAQDCLSGVQMSRVPDKDVLKGLGALVALAVMQGCIIGVVVGVSFLLFTGRLAEYPMLTCQFDRFACQASFSRLLLPFPAPNECNLTRFPCVSLTGFDVFVFYNHLRAQA